MRASRRASPRLFGLRNLQGPRSRQSESEIQKIQREIIPFGFFVKDT
jgi:hypothetical protein